MSGFQITGSNEVVINNQLGDGDGSNRQIIPIACQQRTKGLMLRKQNTLKLGEILFIITLNL